MLAPTNSNRPTELLNFLLEQVPDKQQLMNVLTQIRELLSASLGNSSIDGLTTPPRPEVSTSDSTSTAAASDGTLYFNEKVGAYVYTGPLENNNMEFRGGRILSWGSSYLGPNGEALVPSSCGDTRFFKVNGKSDDVLYYWAEGKDGKWSWNITTNRAEPFDENFVPLINLGAPGTDYQKPDGTWAIAPGAPNAVVELFGNIDMTGIKRPEPQGELYFNPKVRRGGGQLGGMTWRPTGSALIPTDTAEDDFTSPNNNKR